MAIVNADASGTLGIRMRLLVVRASGAICLDRSRNPIFFVLCIHYVCLGETLIFFRDLNDASILDLPRRVAFAMCNLAAFKTHFILVHVCCLLR